MTSILIPRKHYGQPQGAVAVDWGNPISEKLVFAQTGNSATHGFVPQTPKIAETSLRGGLVGYEFDGSSAVSYDTPLVGLPITVMLLVNIDTNIGNYCFISQGGAGPGNGWKINCNGGDAPYVSLTFGGVADYQQMGGFATRGETVVIVAAMGGGSCRWFKNGIYFGQHSIGTPKTPYQRSTMLGSAYRQDHGYVNVLSGTSIVASAIFNRVLMDYEISSLTANPWQIFKQSPTLLTDEG